MAPVPSDLLEAVDFWAAERPEAEAIVCPERRISWRELQQEVQHAATGLLAMGVGPGDHLAVVAPPRPEFLITLLAAGTIGALWSGLTPKARVEEVAACLRHSRPRVVVGPIKCRGISLLEESETLLHTLTFIEHMVTFGDAFDGATSYRDALGRPRPEYRDALEVRRRGAGPQQELLLVYTSGATGAPKGVLHTRANVAANAEVVRERVGLSPDSRLLLHFPISHIAASVQMGAAALGAGATIVLLAEYDPERCMQLIASERVTVLGQAPTMYLAQFESPAYDPELFRSVRVFVYGGAAAAPAVVSRLYDLSKQVGARLLTGYGSTEAGGLLTYSQPEDTLELLQETMGKAAAPFEVRIARGDGTEAAPGEPGELQVKGPSLMAGYMNDAQATSAAFTDDGWLRTEDVASLDAAGYLRLHGRKQERFKSGGESVSAPEVERVLEQHPEVLFAAVLPTPDAVYGEVGKAFVVLRPNAKVDAAALRTFCKRRMMSYKAPKHFVFRDELPLLETGKVDKAALQREEH